MSSRNISALVNDTPYQQISVLTSATKFHVSSATDPFGLCHLEIFNTTGSAIVVTITYGLSASVAMSGSVPAAGTVVWEFPLAPGGGDYFATGAATGLRLRGFRRMNPLGP